MQAPLNGVVKHLFHPRALLESCPVEYQGPITWFGHGYPLCQEDYLDAEHDEYLVLSNQAPQEDLHQGVCW